MKVSSQQLTSSKSYYVQTTIQVMMNATIVINKFSGYESTYQHILDHFLPRQVLMVKKESLTFIQELLKRMKAQGLK